MIPVYRPLNRIVRGMVATMCPSGFDVAPVDACDTMDKLVSHVGRVGRIVVWAGSSERTVFGNRADNWRFRAWHDATHLALGEGFDRRGELATLREQIRRVVALRLPLTVERNVCRLLDIEVRGQLAYLDRFGAFPDDQRAFAGEVWRETYL